MERGAKITITLAPARADALRRLADEHYGGNVSLVIRKALDASPVTKSVLALAGKTTKRSG